jgi:hypothetical protein
VLLRSLVVADGAPSFAQRPRSWTRARPPRWHAPAASGRPSCLR